MEKQAIYALRAAHALARAHGHEWAVTLEQSDIDRIAETSSTWEDVVQGITSLTLERSEYPYVGILAPSVTLGQWGWSITHTTGTGRVTWTIDPHWGVRIGVHRPDGRIIDATVQITEDGLYGPIGISVDGTVYRRHIDALRICLDALGVAADMPPASPDPVSEDV